MARTTKAELLEKEGQLVRVFGQKTLFTVSPIPEIDRVRFSIVQLDTGGKEFIDIYLNTEEVRQFCAEIDSGVAKKKIDADTGNYPTAYKWTKGENGAKRLVIGGGMKGVRIQASDSSSGKAKNLMAVVQWPDLLEMVFMFKLMYGLVPIQAGSYYDNLYQAFQANVANRQNIFKGYNAALDDDAPMKVIEEEEPAAQKASPAPVVANEGVVKTIATVSRGPVQKHKNLFGVPVIIEETGEETTLIFTEEQVATLKWFDGYIRKIEITDTRMAVKAYRKGKNFYFVDTAKK